ncbi:uncharacterized protein O3C94_000984 [Discoglossus pictus]
MAMIRTWIEPVVAGAQVASSFYDTGLLLVVKNHYNFTNISSNSSSDDELQKAISNFYIYYNLILGLTPLLSAYILAKLGDNINRKITICVPLGGYLISRSLLLCVILLDWPIEVMFGSAALNGITGWFTAYWAGVMALASLGSSESRRSLRLIIIEMVYGLAGFVGSLVSGHIFIHFKITNHEGIVLISLSIALYALCFLYSLLVLKIPHIEETYQDTSSSVRQQRSTGTGQSESSRLLGNTSGKTSDTDSVVTGVLPSKIVIAILFTSGILYNVAVNGAVDVLNLYLLKEPLSWGPVDIGYGNAAGYLIFITSFLGVYFFSKRLPDLTMIIIGMVSFCAGIFIMAFVRWTFLYYIARAVMMFSLIPLPTIRAVLSKHVQGSSYGKVFVVLQLSLAVSAVITSIAFNKIYQATLVMFSGFCFILSGIIGILSIVPISILLYLRLSRPQHTCNELSKKKSSTNRNLVPNYAIGLTMPNVKNWIEPVVAGSQFASSFYETGLLMVVKNHYNTTYNSSSEHELQKDISNFYIIYNLTLKLTSMVFAYILAKLGDTKNRKIPICVPLVGSLVSNLCLLFVILLNWPVEVMFGAAAFNGLTGWFTAYWAGVMAIASLSSSEDKRSIRLIINECIFGLAGFIGSLISGHIFSEIHFTNHEGTTLIICSIACYVFNILYSLFVLRIPSSKEAIVQVPSLTTNEDDANYINPINTEYTEHSRLLDNTTNGTLPAKSSDYMLNVSLSKVLLIFIFISAALYNAAVNGAEDVINFFVLKEPLSWGPVEVGYGNAAAYMIFITSFLGVYVFSRCMGDLGMIIIGMLSFCVGILIMAFVRWTFLYYIARVAMMFSLIPIPTIRSLLSKHVQESSYGKVFVVLQMGISIVAVMASTAFIEIYQATLDWFSGFCFIVIFIISCISFIPISVTAYKQCSRNGQTQMSSEN